MGAEKPINLAVALRKALAAMQRAKIEAEDTSIREAELHILAAIQYEAKRRDAPLEPERIAKALESLVRELGCIAGNGIAVRVLKS